MKVPVHYLTTRRKRSYLDRLTARLTHAVRLWSGIIEEHGLRTRGDCSPFEREVRAKPALSPVFVQQARDKALWAWKQHRRAHQRWRRMMGKAKEGTEWHERLRRREPSRPFPSRRSRLRRIPTHFDRPDGSRGPIRR